MSTSTINIDTQEVEKFDNLSSDWWDPNGRNKPLHHLNPLRLSYIEQHIPIKGKQMLDIGCGGGLLAEAMARQGAEVTGIDAGKEMIAVARDHAEQSNLNIHYQHTHVEAFAPTATPFDAITCMELLEHVPDPRSLLKAAASCLKPGGHLFLSTLNRTPKAYALGVFAAERVLKLLPVGTHEYQKFIKPSELSRCLNDVGLTFEDIQGVQYNPITEKVRFSQDVSINYLVHATKPE